jgi:hypothetical protein
MAKIPRLSAVQWRSIENDLPLSRRDRLVISALVFRATEARSLRECSEIFGVSRARLNEWEHAVESALPRILRKLRLEPATDLMRLRLHGGQDWRKRHPGLYESSMARRVEDFGRALRCSDRARKSADPRQSQQADEAEKLMDAVMKLPK